MKGDVKNIYRSMLDNLSALRAFVAVVESGSFSEAGYRLNVMPSTISKHVSFLEEKIHGQLIVRSTKHLSVSELGRRFYDRCLIILKEVEETEAEMLEYQMEPQGKLRITVGPSFAGYHLPRLIPSFLERYPKISLDFRVTPELVDLIDHSIDVAIRISSNLEPGLIAVKLAPNIRSVCVSPAYVEKFGMPAEPRDLENHNCLLTNEASSTAKWRLLQDGVENVVHVSGNLVVNHGDIYKQAILDGVGIGHLSRYLVYQEINDGRLIELFPDRGVVNSFIYVVYPQRRNLPLKTRVFIDHLRDAFRGTPEWMA
ncbi:LysR family transcriptional regulator [Sphingomonas histidinilytica]|jgi:DNA-binding transcriptional LysR family regulator|uniref:Transcriptional regulator, LysR family n=1 Tax=Rhizorhabdus histidinilytica TaxID=439228 RepID=A0A1T5CX97_9SPHN|nr:LysR family transcriptional regulator [Rhizorhabdus histidinilytica]MBO9376290.1 LysR family transcriptional regulator [Rhizorhabdus histidinilytica]QEH79098.1 LysR family transcriptional regulator [Sphingomonas sp. C8-2]SKB63956.1 transcriptional regulator, LysR family [Rhizorhabdus histidinilytica]